jgi:hypothetical protein
MLAGIGNATLKKTQMRESFTFITIPEIKDAPTT